MKSIAIRNGLLAGGILVIMMTLSMILLNEENIGFRQAEILGYVTMLLAFSLIFFGVRQYSRERGALSFGQAFRLGIIITLVASVLYVIGWLILSNTIATDFGEQYYDYFIQQLEESGKPQEEIDRAVASYEKNKEMYKNPLVQAGVSFLEIFPIGFIVSVLTALVLRRKSR
jgi:hypothetical protein